MATIVSYGVSPSYALAGTFEITDLYGADPGETYLTSGIDVFGGINIDATWPINSWDVNEIETSSSYNGLCCLYLYPDGSGCHTCYGTNSGLSPNIFATIKGDTNTGDPWGANSFPFSYWNPSMVQNMAAVLSCNIPIFDNISYVSQYLTAADADVRASLIRQHAINYIPGPVEPEGTDFSISNPWQHGTWTAYGPSPDSPISYRNVRGKIIGDGKLALYRIGLINGSLKMGIKQQAVFSALEYSTDGVTWHDTDSFPFDFFYAVRVNELGTFNYGLSLGTDRIPIWKNEEDADDYIDGDKPIEDAENWDQISPGHPDPHIPGDPDAITDFGEVGARSIFSQQYIVPLAVLYEIANTFYDTTTAGLWDDIKKGLEMYGDSPIEAIENLSYYPLDLTQVFPGASQPHIYFGGYKLDLQAGSVYKIANPNGSKDLGSLMFTRINNNWLDFEPYTKLFVNIPYCGEYQLDLSEYYGKQLSVKYFIDTRTGSCCCCLLANGHLIDKFNGQMGVQMPIKLTDFSAYANSQIQTLLGMGGQAAQSMGSVGQTAASAASAGTAGAIAGAGALAVGMGGVLGAKTVYGLAQNNINRYTKTKGGSTSMLNMYMPQTICFTFERNIPDIPSNFYQMNGYPSNKSGTIGSFSGYLKCDTLKLKMPGATDTEMEKARGLLLAGVFI